MMLSDSQLQQIMPKLPASQRSIYLPFLNKIMQLYQINTPLRAAAFLAQISHESGELRFMEEIWGPTAQQQRYEPPSDLAARLGNTQPGDGKRYRGRGPIQITGRANYRKYGSMLGVDIESNPDLAKSTQIAFQIAGTYWQTNGLNELADVQDFIAITKRINGGLNGLADRQKYYERAKSVLGVNQPFSFSTRSFRGMPQISPKSVPSPPVILERGQEAIEEAFATKPAKKKPSAKKPTKKSPRKASKQTMNKKPVKKAAKKAAPKKAAPKKAAPKKAAKKPVKAAKKAVKKAAKKAVKK